MSGEVFDKRGGSPGEADLASASMSSTPIEAQASDLSIDRGGDLHSQLRQELLDNRVVSYEDYGDTKVIQATVGNETYSFRSSSSGWQGTLERDGRYMRSLELQDMGDQAFLDELTTQDITPKLRAALESSRTIDYEEHGEKKVVSVELDGQRYSFARENNEYAEWAVKVHGRDGSYQGMADIRERKDTEFLDQLFRSDLNAELIAKLGSEAKVVDHDIEYRQVISVESAGKIYNFYPDGSSGEWTMEIVKPAGCEYVPLKEEQDIQFLEGLKLI